MEERRVGQEALLLKLEHIKEGQTAIFNKLEIIFDQDNGLFAREAKNTRFRKVASKWLGLIGALALSGALKSWWGNITGG